MVSPSLYIARSACVSMALAAIETFPKECYGLCVGSRNVPLSIDACVPYQLANRKRWEVTASPKSSKRLEAAMEKGRYEVKCQFHSHFHPSAPRVQMGKFYIFPSEYDMREAGQGELEIVVEIKKAYRGSSLRKLGKRVFIAMGKHCLLIGAFTYANECEGRVVYKEINIRMTR